MFLRLSGYRLFLVITMEQSGLIISSVIIMISVVYHRVISTAEVVSQLLE